MLRPDDQTGTPAEPVRQGASGRAACPSCGAGAIKSIYNLPRIPVQSTVLLADEATARNFPTASMAFAWCKTCGMAFNAAFDAGLVDYGAGYEDAQGCSPTFNAFARQLARDWIGAHDLPGRHILEIGCGKGDFLRLICEQGGCSGVGYDPAFVPGRTAEMPGVRFEPRLFTEADIPAEADFIVCRHTLEHVGDVAGFLALVRRACGSGAHVRLGFEVPDLERIVEEGAFWDVYYEHASYFTAGSLHGAFVRAGFDVLDIRQAYGNQYLILDAAPAAGAAVPLRAAAGDLAETAIPMARFAAQVRARIAAWRSRFADWQSKGRSVALWGSGSKAVAFLTTIGVTDRVDAVVDINPARQGKFMPGCPMPIVAPAGLKDIRPDVVIVMNPIYLSEIAADIAALDLHPEIVTVENKVLEGIIA